MKKDIENLIDEASSQIRERHGDGDQLNESSVRAWQEIEKTAGKPVMSTDAVVSDQGCGRFSGLIPAYYNETLDKTRVILLQEHMKECFTCKSQLRRLQSGRKAGQAVTSSFGYTVPVWMKWGSLAAGLLIMVMAAQFMFWAGMLPMVSADAVTVSSLEGSLYALENQEILPVSSGDIYSYGQTLRTGPETGAVVKLRDGSELELAARTEFDVVGGWKGDSVRLNRGNIIIRASDQGSGRLRVLTGDCDVAVKGTIFSV